MKWLCKLSSAIVLVSLLLLLLPSSFIGADDIINVSSGDYNLYAITDPTVITRAATNIETDSAILNMSYTVGDFSPVQVRFAYKKSADSEWSYTDWVSKAVDGTYATTILRLDSSTQYEFKAQLKYDGTETEGATSSFLAGSHGNVEVDPEDIPPEDARHCFIATAAYGTPIAEDIQILREFRDEYLLTNTVGQAFVDIYYRFSPPIADYIAEHPSLKPIVRCALQPAIVLSNVAVQTTMIEKIGIALVILSLLFVTRKRQRKVTRSFRPGV